MQASSAAWCRNHCWQRSEAFRTMLRKGPGNRKKDLTEWLVRPARPKTVHLRCFFCNPTDLIGLGSRQASRAKTSRLHGQNLFRRGKTPIARQRLASAKNSDCRLAVPLLVNDRLDKRLQFWIWTPNSISACSAHEDNEPTPFSPSHGRQRFGAEPVSRHPARCRAGPQTQARPHRLRLVWHGGCKSCVPSWRRGGDRAVRRGQRTPLARKRSLSRTIDGRSFRRETPKRSR